MMASKKRAKRMKVDCTVLVDCHISKHKEIVGKNLLEDNQIEYITETCIKVANETVWVKTTTKKSGTDIQCSSETRKTHIITAMCNIQEETGRGIKNELDQNDGVSSDSDIDVEVDCEGIESDDAESVNNLNMETDMPDHSQFTIVKNLGNSPTKHLDKTGRVRYGIVQTHQPMNVNIEPLPARTPVVSHNPTSNTETFEKGNSTTENLMSDSVGISSTYKEIAPNRENVQAYKAAIDREEEQQKEDSCRKSNAEAKLKEFKEFMALLGYELKKKDAVLPPWPKSNEGDKSKEQLPPSRPQTPAIQLQEYMENSDESSAENSEASLTENVLFMNAVESVSGKGKLSAENSVSVNDSVDAGSEKGKSPTENSVSVNDSVDAGSEKGKSPTENSVSVNASVDAGCGIGKSFAENSVSVNSVSTECEKGSLSAEKPVASTSDAENHSIENIISEIIQAEGSQVNPPKPDRSPGHDSTSENKQIEASQSGDWSDGECMDDGGFEDPDSMTGFLEAENPLVEISPEVPEKSSNSTESPSNDEADDETPKSTCTPLEKVNVECQLCGQTFDSSDDLAEHMLQKHPGQEENQCSVCNKKFRLRSTLLAHLVVHTEDRAQDTHASSSRRRSSPFTCEICGKLCRSRTNLERHSITHQKERPFKCKVCGKTFKTDSSLASHMLVHATDKPFQCKKCDHTFAREKQLREHEKRHQEERNFECDECGKKFKVKSDVTSHKRMHRGEKKFKCDICNKAFLTPYKRTRHMAQHTSEKPFKCTFCDMAFNTQENRKSHQKRKHGAERKQNAVACDVCGKEFACNMYLRQHRLIHGEGTSATCELCGKTIRKTHMAMHLKIHSGKKDVICEICGQGFYKTNQLTVHMAKHLEKKPFPCSFCGKTYTTKATVLCHERSHTGERPFKCNTCGECFTSSFRLKKHMYGHSNLEKPFKCMHCDKTYWTKWSLKHHIYSHTGEKPYKCQGCDKVYADHKGLKRHNMTSHCS